MYSYKNVKYLDEIRKWNTAQLIEALQTNGLSDCCEAIQIREIDGDTFLNLTEGQLAFWRNTLNNVQIKRLWSHIQLAREKPQDFITSFPQNKPKLTVTNNARQLTRENLKDFPVSLQNKPMPTGTLNSRKVEKIKSPIADKLENLFGQQNDPTPATEIPENNYPKLQPLHQNNEFQLPVPPQLGALPPKPSNLVKRFPAPPPIESAFQDVNSRPTISPYFSNSSPNQQEEEEEEEDIYEDEPMVELQNQFPPPPSVNSSSLYKKQIPHPIRKEAPLPINAMKSYVSNSSQYQEHEEDIYEDEPMSESQNDVPPGLPAPNLSPIYKIPPSNPIPIRRAAPLPINFGRKLPTPPKDEIPFRLPPNVVPVMRNARSPLPPEISDLPRPPVSFVPPAHIPDFNHDDDEDLVEYDFVDEAQPEYKLQSWFKDTGRKEAGRLLQGHPNGTFIARPSTQPDYECTFSVIYESKIYNLPVIKENDKVVLGKNAFGTVMEIVDKFLEVPLVLNGPNHEDVYLTLRKYEKM